VLKKRGYTIYLLLVLKTYNPLSNYICQQQLIKYLLLLMYSSAKSINLNLFITFTVPVHVHKKATSLFTLKIISILTCWFVISGSGVRVLFSAGWNKWFLRIPWTKRVFVSNMYRMFNGRSVGIEHKYYCIKLSSNQILLLTLIHTFSKKNSTSTMLNLVIICIVHSP